MLRITKITNYKNRIIHFNLFWNKVNELHTYLDFFSFYVILVAQMSVRVNGFILSNCKSQVGPRQKSMYNRVQFH